MERAWQEWSALPAYGSSDLKRFPSQEAFFASTPRLYWRDSFGRLLRLRRADLKPPCMAEPIVYFYPEQSTRVRYTLAPVVQVARAVPLAKGNSWTFLATPQGILEEVEAAEPGRARQTFAHLFWEGTSMRFAPPAEGVCVPSAHSGEFFREVLPRLGLLSHETEDFVAAWAPRLQGAAFHVIGFHPREEVEALAPVEVSPAPANMIRILMDATPVEACPAGLTPPSLPDAPPARRRKSRPRSPRGLMWPSRRNRGPAGSQSLWRSGRREWTRPSYSGCPRCPCWSGSTSGVSEAPRWSSRGCSTSCWCRCFAPGPTRSRRVERGGWAVPDGCASGGAGHRR